MICACITGWNSNEKLYFQLEILFNKTDVNVAFYMCKVT